MQPIGIIAAMPEEIELILSQMSVDEVIESGMRKYYTGNLYERPCVIVQSRIGKVASAVTAAFMIVRFKVSTIILIGVAGGIADKVKIGDICIAAESIQHDMDASGLFPKYEIPLLGISRFRSDANLFLIAKSAALEFLQLDFEEYVSPECIENFKLENIRVHTGLLGSGDRFIGSQDSLTALKKELPDLLFVDMEGAAVAQVCFEYEVKLLNLRIISDSANNSAHLDFEEFIDKVAKYYALGVIKHIINKL